jgi:hypothetical protein
MIFNQLSKKKKIISTSDLGLFLIHWGILSKYFIFLPIFEIYN